MTEKAKATPQKPRNIDPEIAKLRAEHNDRVANLRRTKQSKALLRTITEKRLPMLLEVDRENLLDVLMENTTRCFPAMLKSADCCRAVETVAPTAVEATVE